MDDDDTKWSGAHVAVVAKMVRYPVTGSVHKQRDTIKNWCSGYDGDVIDAAIDDLLAKAVLQQYRSNTIQLVSVSEAKEFIEENDESGDYSWYI